MGWGLLVALGAGAVTAVTVGTRVPDAPWVGWTVGAALLAAMLTFSSLTVTVTRAEVRVAFGPGLPRRRFAAADIRSARAVRTRWYHGWGIHRTGRGWLMNVAGFDAVELELASGRHVLVGTDEPQRLLGAVRQVASGRA